MAASNENLFAAIQSMSARLEAVKSTVDVQAMQLGPLATALQDIKGAQSRADEWQSRIWHGRSHCVAQDGGRQFQRSRHR